MNRFYLLGPTCQGQMNSACAAMEKKQAAKHKSRKLFCDDTQGFWKERRKKKKKIDFYMHSVTDTAHARSHTTNADGLKPVHAIYVKQIYYC